MSAGKWLGQDTELSKFITALEGWSDCKDQLGVSLQRTFVLMSTAEQTALKAVVQLNKDSLEKVLTLSWLIIAAKLEDNFVTFVQKRRGGLQVNGRYKEISLSSVILLHKHHPSLGNIKSHDSHPAYATIGCIRLKKFHEFIDKGANILLRTLYSMAHPQSKWIEVVLYMEF